MDNNTLHSYHKAIYIAEHIEEKLAKYSQMIDIAGSLRRKKEKVKDIEILAYPMYDTIHKGGDMFTPAVPTKKVSANFCLLVNGLGKVIKGKPDGKYMQIELPSGIMLDLFMPDAHDYYRQLAIRTGSADYAKLVIAFGWKKKGWCGSDLGLRKITDCYQVGLPGKQRWQCTNPDGERPPVWASEEEFFDWIGVKWIAPELRSLPY